jgi:uncharacterized cofD-like protein
LKRIVTLGTGTGQSTLIEGLEAHEVQLTAVVAVTDNGGHSGVVRRSLGIPQPGDSRSCLTALSRDPLLKGLFEYRFTEGELGGVSLGNLILGALARTTGDFGKAVEIAGRLLKIKGAVFPVSTTSTEIAAELGDGRTIVGEWEIIRRAPRTPITRMFLRDKALLHPPVGRAIAAASVIVLGPGTLRTGLVSLLLTEGLADALRQSSAPKVLVMNLMTQPGQTDGMSAAEHVREVERYLGAPLDKVILNDAPVPNEIALHYKEQGAEPVRDDLGADAPSVIRVPLLESTTLEEIALHRRPDNVHLLRHDPKKLAEAVIAIANAGKKKVPS